MSITFVEHIYKVKANNYAVSKKIENTPLAATKLYNMFFVIGRATCGGRFYSETTENYREAYQLFSSYKSVVEYFGGGEVELVAVSENGYDIVDICKI